MSSGSIGEFVAANADPIPLGAGSVFHERYEVVRCMGAGGMGAVYEVLDRATQRRRVLKTMLPTLLTDSDMRARFKQEATITADIESEHIVEVFDAGYDEEHGQPFLVMELLRGENLADLLRRQGRLEHAFVVALLGQASLALERTHAAGIVHRDLKPENLFLTRRDDGSPRLKLLDFGIAKVVAQSANLTTTRSFGTPLYMSPEQVRGDGDIDGRADLYALGQIAFTLLVGRPYWAPEAENPSGLYALLLRVVEGTEEAASQRASRSGVTLPADFDAWFRRATARSPDERFDSASELVVALRRVFEPPAIAASPNKDVPVPMQPVVPCLEDSVARAPEAQTLDAVSSVAPRGEGSNPLLARKGNGPGRARVWRWAALWIGGVAISVPIVLRTSPTLVSKAEGGPPSSAAHRDSGAFGGAVVPQVREATSTIRATSGLPTASITVAPAPSNSVSVPATSGLPTASITVAPAPSNSVSVPATSATVSQTKNGPRGELVLPNPSVVDPSKVKAVPNPNRPKATSSRSGKTGYDPSDVR